jgi:peptidyl-prolyl cis-trans isomerase B (cyclophilin B)
VVAPTPVAVKRYDQAPALTIDPTKRYLATIKTAKGEIQMELYPDRAPEAVNAFVFLARDGYYNGTPFMQVTKNADGSRFTAQAGDPTRTGLGTPGFTVKQEITQLPFTKGAVGFDSGQFYISYGDYPALNNKNAIFGKVVAGMDVLDSLSLLDVTITTRQAGGTGDQIESVTITES